MSHDHQLIFFFLMKEEKQNTAGIAGNSYCFPELLSVAGRPVHTVIIYSLLGIPQKLENHSSKELKGFCLFS